MNIATIHFMMFILGKNDIGLIAVEYFEKLHENKTHQ